jgi:hypothetical protein
LFTETTADKEELTFVIELEKFSKIVVCAELMETTLFTSLFNEMIAKLCVVRLEFILEIEFENPDKELFCVPFTDSKVDNVLYTFEKLTAWFDKLPFCEVFTFSKFDNVENIFVNCVPYVDSVLFWFPLIDSKLDNVEYTFWKLEAWFDKVPFCEEFTESNSERVEYTLVKFVSCAVNVLF